MWGSNAYDKLKIISNKDSHKFIISSHPSPLSAHKPFKNYKSFIDTDHFGLINKYIEEFNKSNVESKTNKRIEPIVWDLF